MQEKTCCVTGHREIPEAYAEEIKAALKREILQAVQDGYTRFLSGFAEGVDQWFAGIVAQLCKENPALRLEAVVPYRNRLDALKKKEDTKALLAACTDITVISEEYRPNVYMKRNRFLAEQSGRVIAVYDGREKGGTVTTMRFAHGMKKELREISVGPIHIPGKD